MGGNQEVTSEDQKRINLFSQLNTRMHEKEAEVKAHKARIEDFEDASNEIVLADDDAVHYSFGECFLQVEPDAADEKIEEAKGESEERLAELESELEGIKSEMGELKQMLYDKFGDSINLEE